MDSFDIFVVLFRKVVVLVILFLLVSLHIFLISDMKGKKLSLFPLFRTICFFIRFFVPFVVFGIIVCVISVVFLVNLICFFNLFSTYYEIFFVYLWIFRNNRYFIFIFWRCFFLLIFYIRI